MQADTERSEQATAGGNTDLAVTGGGVACVLAAVTVLFGWAWALLALGLVLVALGVLVL